MSRPMPFKPDHSAARAFARVGWAKLVAKLHGYATGSLRLAAVGAEHAGVFEASDLVNTLVEQSLDGTLGWTLPGHATEEEIVGLACMKLSGMRWTLRRRAARELGDDALDERVDPSPDALARLMAQRGLADLARVFQQDAEASAYVRGMLAGNKREEIMAELGLTAERADVVRKRILRGLAATCASDQQMESIRSIPLRDTTTRMRCQGASTCPARRR
jgi:hypothetical protein